MNVANVIAATLATPTTTATPATIDKTVTSALDRAHHQEFHMEDSRTGITITGGTITTLFAEQPTVANHTAHNLRNHSSFSSLTGLLRQNSLHSNDARLTQPSQLPRGLSVRGVTKVTGAQSLSKVIVRQGLGHVAGLESHHPTSATSSAAKLEAALPSSFTV